MPMTYEVVDKIIQKAGGLKGIRCIINDAGMRIDLEQIAGQHLTVDQDLNCLVYPAIDDEVPVMVHLSLDSLADIRTYLNDKIELKAQPYDDYIPASIEKVTVKDEEHPNGILSAEETISGIKGFEKTPETQHLYDDNMVK